MKQNPDVSEAASNNSHAVIVRSFPCLMNVRFWNESYYWNSIINHISPWMHLIPLFVRRVMATLQSRPISKRFDDILACDRCLVTINHTYTHAHTHTHAHTSWNVRAVTQYVRIVVCLYMRITSRFVCTTPSNFIGTCASKLNSKHTPLSVYSYFVSPLFCILNIPRHACEFIMSYCVVCLCYFQFLLWTETTMHLRPCTNTHTHTHTHTHMHAPIQRMMFLTYASFMSTITLTDNPFISKGVWIFRTPSFQKGVWIFLNERHTNTKVTNMMLLCSLCCLMLRTSRFSLLCSPHLIAPRPSFSSASFFLQTCSLSSFSSVFSSWCSFFFFFSSTPFHCELMMMWMQGVLGLVCMIALIRFFQAELATERSSNKIKKEINHNGPTIQLLVWI